MKELTIEEKAQRYDKAIEKFDIILNLNTVKESGTIFADDVRKIFPELKESEDERIRKWIRKELESKYVVNNVVNNVMADKALTWIEKQGEQKSINNLTQQEAMDIAVAKCFNEQKPTDKIEPKFKVKYAGSEYNVLDVKDAIGITFYGIEDEPNHIDYVLSNNCEIVSEQNLINKVESKFHEGDWIISNNAGNPPLHITNINDKHYIFSERDSRIKIEDCDNSYHLWSLKDAKDGDVLFTSSTASHETFIFKSIDEKGNAKCYFAYDSEDGFIREGKYHFIGRATDCKPATKEQRDLLFQKMKEAGYEWNDEKKELKKIEYNSVWSEEDDIMIHDIDYALRCHITYPISKLQSMSTWINNLKNRIQSQNFTVTDTELAQAKKDAYNDALNKIEYHSGEPTFDDGWSAAIWYLKKKNAQPKQEWSSEDKENLLDVKCIIDEVWHKEETEFSSEKLESLWYWLDNLWKRVKYLQNTWNPTDKQIIALRWVLNNIPYDSHKEEISGLLEQLNKLKEK